MKKIAVILVAFACVSILFLSMCKRDTTSATSSQLAVRLKDAPNVHCDRARLEIRGIRIYSPRDGWITIPINDTIIDILRLQDTSALLGVVNIDAGTITQVDVTLGTQDSVTIAGITYVLSLTASDLVINVNDTLTPHSGFTLVIDINAAESIFDDGDMDGHHHYRLQGSGSCFFRRDHNGWF